MLLCTVVPYSSSATFEKNPDFAPPTWADFITRIIHFFAMFWGPGLVLHGHGVDTNVSATN
jgi:hypothetical protein